MVRRRATESGIALAIVLMILLVLLVLAMSVLVSTATNAAITGNYRVSNESFSVANAGLERVMKWFTSEYNPQPASSYSITPLGVKMSGNPVAFKGIPSTPGGSVPASNFPQSGTIASFVRDFSERDVVIGDKNYGRYSVNAVLVSLRSTSLPFGGIESIERWQIDIKASPPNSSPKSQITALIEVGTPAFFGYAIKADQSIDIKCSGSGGGGGSGGGSGGSGGDDDDDGGGGGGGKECLIDSFDSKAGGYGFGSLSGDPASLGTNGDIRLQGDGVIVKGDGDYINSIDIKNGASLSGKKNKLAARLQFNVFNSTPPSSPSSDILLDSGISISRGPGVYGKIEVKDGASLTLNGSGVYYAKEVKVDGASSRISVNPTGEPGYITLLVDGKFEVKKGGMVALSTAPTKLLIYAKAASLSQGKVSAALYAYTTDNGIIDVTDNLLSGEVRMDKKSELLGAIITKRFDMKNGASVHYDTALYDQFKLQNRFRLIYWTYRSFF